MGTRELPLLHQSRLLMRMTDTASPPNTLRGPPVIQMPRAHGGSLADH